MPAQDTKVLNYILSLYIVYDKQQEEEDKEAQKPVFSLARIMSIAETAKDYITGNDKIKKILSGICDDVKFSINSPNKTPEDWIRIIFELGDKAAIAQSVKPTAGQSRCCEILHAMRNEIVKCMIKEDDEYRKAFEEKMADLKESIRINDDNGDVNVLEKNGVGVDEIDKDVMNAYRQLAYMEDKVSIRRAKRYGLIDHLLMINEREEQFRTEKIREASVCHFTGNKALPYLLQSDTFETLYADKYQKQTSYSSIDFRTKGIPSKDKKLPESKKAHVKNGNLPAKEDNKEKINTSDKENLDTTSFEDLSPEISENEERNHLKDSKSIPKDAFRMFGRPGNQETIITPVDDKRTSSSPRRH